MKIRILQAHGAKNYQMVEPGMEFEARSLPESL